MEKDGVIQRIAYNQPPPRIEYFLTNYGWPLESILNSLCTFWECHREKNGNTSMLITADE